MKIILPFMLSLVLFSCKSKKNLTKENILQEVNIDYRLLPSTTYRMTSIVSTENENITKGNLDSIRLQQPSSLSNIYNTISSTESTDIKTMSTSEQKDNIFFTIITDSIYSNIQSPILDNLDKDFRESVKTAAQHQLAEIGYGHSADQKMTKIDSVHDASADPIFGNLLYLRGTIVWNAQDKLPSGLMTVGDSYIWEKPTRKRTTKKERKDLTPEMLAKLDPEQRKRQENLNAASKALDERSENHTITYLLSKIENDIAYFDFTENEGSVAGNFMIGESNSNGKIEYDIKNQCYRKFEKFSTSSLEINADGLNSVNKINSHQLWTIEVIVK